MLQRFGAGTRWVHAAVAALMLACLLTAAMLYIPDLSAWIGRRELVSRIHVACGVLLPVPILVGALLSRGFRADVRALDRFGPYDTAWLRAGDRRSGRIPVGKFNAGQKLNGAFTLGAVLVMLGTGAVMRWGDALPVDLRTGATFVHDWLALAVVVVVCGHLWFAWRDPTARAGMRTGVVPYEWAAREHGAWAAAATTRRDPGP